jgi:aminoglycoside phosphotransferase (APT) family kinase protein
VALGLAAWLEEVVGGPVTDVERMLGGASRETWSFAAAGRPLVLRRDPDGAPRSGGMPLEAALLRAAAAAGVPVPAVVAAGESWIVVTRLSGETIARRILRDPQFTQARAALTEQCATALARLHTGVRPGDIDGLAAPADPLSLLRDQLDALGEPHPAFELGLRRLAEQRPAASSDVVAHGDFRLGNLVVDASGLTGVLDWELAHAGDPVEDLGWLCVRSWRFGGAAPVAGVGSREELLAAYAAAGGAVVAVETLRWWEAVGTLRWGVICVQQAATHLSGAVRSVELAAIGRRVCEVALDLLDLLEPGLARTAEVPTAPAGQAGPHDRPTAAELTVAVREWIDGLALSGHDAFLARVAARSLDIVGRELALGPALQERHVQRLAGLGVGSEAELAGQVRAGRDDPATVHAIRATVVDKLLVADPRQLGDTES